MLETERRRISAEPRRSRRGEEKNKGRRGR